MRGGGCKGLKGLQSGGGAVAGAGGGGGAGGRMRSKAADRQGFTSRMERFGSSFRILLYIWEAILPL